jgi:hypothetical protein
MSADRAAGNRDNVVMQDRDPGFRLPGDVQKTGGVGAKVLTCYAGRPQPSRSLYDHEGVGGQQPARPLALA